MNGAAMRCDSSQTGPPRGGQSQVPAAETPFNLILEARM